MLHVLMKLEWTLSKIKQLFLNQFKLIEILPYNVYSVLKCMYLP